MWITWGTPTPCGVSKPGHIFNFGQNHLRPQIYMHTFGLLLIMFCHQLHTSTFGIACVQFFVNSSIHLKLKERQKQLESHIRQSKNMNAMRKCQYKRLVVHIGLPI
ncbi:uncharacterized protein [Musca autumnalis]|uniref:uncharacterized protein n=1 Tax=Musca autumnalis TaxID=221902 RepID=UPI003CFB7286